MARNYRKFPPLIERFEQKVDKSPGHGPNGDCWVWTASTKYWGYGAISVPGKGVRGAHRVSYELTHGPIPPGMFVLHRCDNPPCVNPDHLILGTPADNIRDMIARGRKKIGVMPKGMGHHRAKLTDSQVIEIRRLWDSGGATKLGLSKQFGVSRPVIRGIVERRSWRHI